MQILHFFLFSEEERKAKDEQQRLLEAELGKNFREIFESYLSSV